MTNPTDDAAADTGSDVTEAAPPTSEAVMAAAFGVAAKHSKASVKLTAITLAFLALQSGASYTPEDVATAAGLSTGLVDNILRMLAKDHPQVRRNVWLDASERKRVDYRFDARA